MNIMDLLYNRGTSPAEGSYIFFDGTNRVHGELPNEVWLCEEVMGCIALEGVTHLFEVSNDSLTNDGVLAVITDFINEAINISYNNGNLFVGGTSIDVNNIIDSPFITFRDQRSNYFNLIGRNTVEVEGIDGLTTVIDNGNIYLLLPTPNDRYFSDHMNDGPQPQLPGDYLPFNHRLVLTRDGINHEAFWAVDQCCAHVLEFDNGLLTADGGESHVDLTSINTDNQELSLDDNTLSLTRWHGGANGEQVQDPDSVVDLINVNEHTLQLNTHRYLDIMGSDGIMNHREDLFMVGPKKLTFNKTTNELSLHNDEGTIVSTEDISGVNKQLLTRHNGFLWLSGKVVSQVGFRKPVQICPEAMACICNQKLTKEQRYARGLLSPGQRDMGDRWAARNLPQPTDWPENMKVIMDRPEGFSICDMADAVFSAVGMPSSYKKYVYVNINMEVDIYFDYYYSYYHNDVTNEYTNIYSIDRRRYYDYRSYDNRTYDNSRTYNDYRTYITIGGGGGIAGPIQEIQKVVSRSKYRGRIYATENRVMWSANTFLDSETHHARRYFPNFDGGDGWSATGGTLTPYNNMLFADNFIVSHGDRLKLADGRERLLADPLGYTMSKSVNNPKDPTSGKCSEFGSKTITIPYDGNYLVSLNSEVEVDHNVFAFRVAVLKMDLLELGGLGVPQPIVDTKFGGGKNVGSSSLNNPVYPLTKQYTCSGSKLVSLKKGDVLAVGVRIDATTRRPKKHPQNWLNQQTGHGPTSGFSRLNFYGGTPDWAGGLYVQYSEGDLPTLGQTYPRPIPNGAGDIYPTSRSTYSIGEGKVGRSSMASLRPTPSVPDIGNRYYFSPHGGSGGAQNYGYVLNRGTPSEDGGGGYWKDDGVVTLLGPSNVVEATGGQSYPVIDEGGSMLTVVYQNKDYLEIDPNG